MRSSRTSKSKPRRRSQLARTWSELWPLAAVISVFGMAAVMQIGACARVTVIQSELKCLDDQETTYEADIQALRCELAKLQDVSTLHEYMISHGYTKECAVVDVTVNDLPGELLATLPQTDPVAPASGGEQDAVIASLAQ